MALLLRSRDRVGVNGARATRLAIAAALVAATGLLAASAFATSRSEKSLPALNRQVLAAVNRFRVAHGLVALRESPALDRSARQHSLEMGKLGYFGHASADGTAFWRRIGHYYGAGRYTYWSVGENLLWAAPGVSAGRAMKMWIASPEHLRNLESARWRQIGVSAVRVVRAPGVFHNLRVTIITTDFGVRR
ncbi:MAG TPA: CAP domain-containing protein [Gaiellaceae bacterium]